VSRVDATSTSLEKYKLGRGQAALQVPLQSGPERAPADLILLKRRTDHLTSSHFQYECQPISYIVRAFVSLVRKLICENQFAEIQVWDYGALKWASAGARSEPLITGLGSAALPPSQLALV